MIFVDTSFLIALVVKEDNFHREAVKCWQKMKTSEVVVINAVVWETLSWVRYKIGKKEAVRVMGLLYGEEIVIVKVSEEDEIEAGKIFAKTDGRGLSMIDCLSMAVMKRWKTNKILAFDEDFEKGGFEIIPKIA